MSFVVRRAGNGDFNPRTVCFSPDERFAFVGCGPLVNIYQLPDLEFYKSLSSHKANITSMVASESSLISSDRAGVILFHRYNEITVLDQTPCDRYEHSAPIEKLLVRGDRLFFVFFKSRAFHVSEYDKKSIFMVEKSVQDMLWNVQMKAKGKSWLMFPALDAFDINDQVNAVVVADDCKLHIYDFMTDEVTNINLQQPARICMFRGSDVLVFTSDGHCQQFGSRKLNDHWHYVCPNAVVFDNAKIYSGGAEGVLLTLHENSKRHRKLPRLGMTIEGLALSARSSFLAAVVDRNILALVDCDKQSVHKFWSHICGDVVFSGNILVSLRRPNLVQFFAAKTGELLNQLQVSSYNSRVAVSVFAMAGEYLVTVETSGGKQQSELSRAQQVEFNHVKPHGDANAAQDVRKGMIRSGKIEERKKILKMRYEVPKDIEEHERFEKIAVEGNPLGHDKQATEAANYSEVKIWTRKDTDNGFQMDQTFRVIGKVISSISVHPRLALFCMVVGKELQLWKHSGKWIMWKSRGLGETPSSIKWSPDGTIIAAVFRDRVEFVDVEVFAVVAQSPFEDEIISASFTNDFLLSVHTKAGIAIFDLRSLSVTKMLFLNASHVTSGGGCTAFAVTKNQQESQLNVVLYHDGAMKSWQLPTQCRAKSINVVNDRDGIRIAVVDTDNFLWSIDQYGSAVEGPARLTTISRPKPREMTPKATVEFEEDRTVEMLKMLDFPSHQIPTIEDLCESLYSVVLDTRSDVDVVTIPVACDGIGNDYEDVPVVALSPQDLAGLKQMF